ncbi:hypothetical protein EMCG_08263 [[Emmonsia] crescens]|uniref:Major facilitator superfamily (MFS) profile domain-containing protein n=1 Tax=[Emmonsia] crescens TaxID=73230 RepID=A0A0G2J4L4_9EURO|nr:hypothetical protein EMCG_08263 [Emmonsia crescens UAMH 3008]
MALFIINIGVYIAQPVTVVWLSNNLAWHYKRAFRSAFQISFGNIGGIVASSLFIPNAAPLFRAGYASALASIALCALLCTFMLGLERENKKTSWRTLGMIIRIYDSQIKWHEWPCRLIQQESQSDIFRAPPPCLSYKHPEVMKRLILPDYSRGHCGSGQTVTNRHVLNWRTEIQEPICNLTNINCRFATGLRSIFAMSTSGFTGCRFYSAEKIGGSSIEQ